MGVIRIETQGSFGDQLQSFSAENGGHADAVSQAIEYLAKKLLPDSIAKDHALAADGVKPKKSFGRGRG